MFVGGSLFLRGVPYFRGGVLISLVGGSLFPGGFLISLAGSVFSWGVPYFLSGVFLISLGGFRISVGDSLFPRGVPYSFGGVPNFLRLCACKLLKKSGVEIGREFFLHGQAQEPAIAAVLCLNQPCAA